MKEATVIAPLRNSCSIAPPLPCSSRKPGSPASGGRNWIGSCRRAFSLVEVALALGIVSFGLLSLVGVVPLAMDRYRDAADSSVSADVMRSLVGELEWAYSENETPDLSPRYFTMEGIETSNVQDGLYEAKIEEQSAGKVKIFGSPLDELKAVKVEIYRLPVGDKSGAEPISVFTTYVAS